MRGSAVLAALLAASLLPAAPARAAGGASPHLVVAVDAAGHVSIRATRVPLDRLLGAIGRAAGIRISALGPLHQAPVTLHAGPQPIERLVRWLVRPHGVAALYGRANASRVGRLIVVPATVGPSSAAGRASAPAPDRDRVEQDQLASDAAEAELHRLGASLDDPDAVARLEAIAEGGPGGSASDALRHLARQILSIRPGLDEADEDGEAGG
jgi:hypothetical protein